MFPRNIVGPEHIVSSGDPLYCDNNNEDGVTMFLIKVPSDILLDHS